MHIIYSAVPFCRCGQPGASLWLSAAQESSADAGSIAALTDAPTWIVDPVDGTTNFVHGFPMTCVSIGFGRGKKVSQSHAICGAALCEKYGVVCVLAGG